MRTAAAALKAIKKAVAAGAWRADPHLAKQIAKRGIQVLDVVVAVKNAKRSQPHDMLPLNAGGESWRVYVTTPRGAHSASASSLLRTKTEKWSCSSQPSRRNRHDSCTDM